MIRKKNVRNRRMVALENLKIAKFFPKTMRDGKQRNEERWNERVKTEIDILQKRV